MLCSSNYFTLSTNILNTETHYNNAVNVETTM